MKLGGERSISQKEIVLVTGNGLYRNMLQGLNLHCLQRITTRERG